MTASLLRDMVIVLGLSAGVVFLCNRLRVPSIVGFLVTGVFAGPYGLSLLSSPHDIELLAEIGVVLLLFTIGMEFSFKKLLEIKKTVILGGSLQVMGTIAVSAFLSNLLGKDLGASIFLGFLISLSSTAIVLKLIQERAEIDTPQGRTSLGILIYQDLIVIPMLLVCPILAGTDEITLHSSLSLVAKGLLVIAVTFVSAKWVMPRILHLVAVTRSKELFIITIVLTCLAIAWLTSFVGLSLALGAFIAGLIISESPYSHQAIANILPLKDIFTSIFFVSIGMLMDVRFLSENFGTVVLAAMAIVLLKSLTAGMATVSIGLPMRIALLVGLALSQVGEFSFLLSQTGMWNGLIGGDDYQLFLNVSVLTMSLTPAMIGLGVFWSQKLPRGSVPDMYLRLRGTHREELRKHIIIVGFGVNGRNVARAAKACSIPYAIVEMNPWTVREESAKGEPIIYGDAVYDAVLEHVGIHEARVLVVTIADPPAVRRIVTSAKLLNPKVHIIARTRFLQELEPLLQLGADEVIPEEYETAVEIFARVMRRFLIPKEEIDRFVAEVRSEGYEMFRTLSCLQEVGQELTSLLQQVDIETFRVQPGSRAQGRTIGELELRKKHGITVLAVQKQTGLVSDPGAETIFQSGDLVVTMGDSGKLACVAGIFYGSADRAC